ncbi:hypothetical protein [Kutzneria sp. NPDC051319]|uniref:non-homologous end-joining DNA ligase LigD n=1 Tax=Kutzneria sp. NPDC051319 TaxID=3155047 RepID=UPI00343235AB
MAAPRKYPDELRERATRLVVEARRDPASAAGAIKRIAEQLGVHPEALAAETPKSVTAVMAKAKREGRVFIDWSQNNPAKTTIAPYSLRGREDPTVSAPVTWDEVRACRQAEDLVFTAEGVVARVEKIGDLFELLSGTRVALPRP